MTEMVRYGIVIPTIGRPSLGVLLRALDQAAAVAAGPEKVVVVDDRTGDGPPLDVRVDGTATSRWCVAAARVPPPPGTAAGGRCRLTSPGWCSSTMT